MSDTPITQSLLKLPLFDAEWVLWLLLALSVASVAVIVERTLFYAKRRIDPEIVRHQLEELLDAGDVEEAARCLAAYDSLETNVTLFGLRAHHRGAEAVQELMDGAAARETERYNERLGFLATLGSNAPFIGLFGTVLGIIKAFAELGFDLGGVDAQLMDTISEALVATAVGLFVAVPAVVAYNTFVRAVDRRVAEGRLLSKTLLGYLKTEAREA